MNEQILEAYLDYTGELARAGIIDHSLNNAILDGKTVEEHIVEVLRAAGRLPEGWNGAPRTADEVTPPRLELSGRITSFESRFSRTILSGPSDPTRRDRSDVTVQQPWLRAS